MIKIARFALAFIIIVSNYCYSQSTAIQSSIINFGSNSCSDKTNVTFSSIGNPSTTPYLISSCAINPPYYDVYNKFIAYNPRDNKIYINDISSGDSRVYIYDMSLPYNYTCPVSMPLTPTYHYSYIPNNWEFDINGDIWCIKGLSRNTATIERIDEATGTILFSKTVDFPAGNPPNTLSSGDMVILPNGRMFMVMGDSPSKFFEVTNYSTSSGNATATFIQNMSSPCYGILYINGKIQLTGTDFGSNCYKYLFDIPSYSMGAQQPFQLGLTPIDNSSISPATGLSKQFLSNTMIDNTTSDIMYEIYAKNIGNVKLNNFNILEDLAALYGTGNISNVSVSLEPGLNPDNLVLNPSFDGVNNTKIFNDNQIMSNLNIGYVGVTISFRVSNLVNNKVYYSTSKSVGEIGIGGTRVLVVDSSNNGLKTAIDPNNDGDAGDIGENMPTPFYFGIVLPINFVDIKAQGLERNLNTITWTIAKAEVPIERFEIEYSQDHISWGLAGTVTAEKNSTSYSFNHPVFSGGTVYYRVKAYELSGKNYLSSEALVKRLAESNIIIKPNPADGQITVYSPEENYSPFRRISIVNDNGIKIFSKPFTAKNIYIDVSYFPSGYYVINIMDKGKLTSLMVLISHR